MKWNRAPKLSDPRKDELSRSDSDSFRSVNLQIPGLLEVTSPWRSLTSDTWMWEILAISFSGICFIALSVVVFVYDEKPSPSLPHDLTLNTVISILATASKSSLIFAVGSSLGQLKWIWFLKSDKHLRDMQLFDDATRGPWGSAIMLLQHKGLSIASLGALITLLALVFEPFLQLVMTFPLRQVPDLSSFPSAKQVRSMYAVYNDQGPNTAFEDILGGFYDAQMQGIWTDVYERDYLTCPSSNCTWPAFKSVGYCSKCEDVTSEATLVGCNNVPYEFDGHGFHSNITERWSINCTVSLPHGYSPNTRLQLLQDGGLYQMTLPGIIVWQIHKLPNQILFTDGPPLNTTFLGIENPLLVIGFAELDIVTTDQDAGGKAVFRPEESLKIKKVTECVLSLCSRTHNSSFTNGVPQVGISPPEFGQIWYKYISRNFEEGQAFYDTCWTQWGGVPQPQTRIGGLNDSSWLTKPELPVSIQQDKRDPTGMGGKAFAFCHVEDLIPDITQYLIGSRNFSTFCWAEEEPYCLRNTQTIDELFRQTPEYDRYWDPTQSNGEVQALDGFDRITRKGLEGVMRSIASSMTMWALSHTTDFINGTAIIPEVYVKVHWPWMALPATLIILSAVLLVSTIMLNRRQNGDLWKTSSLPTIYHGLEDDILISRGPNFELSTMETSAGSMKVHLQYSDIRGRFVLQEK